MRLEAGKYYRARNGMKAFVSAILEPNPFTTDVDELPVLVFYNTMGGAFASYLTLEGLQELIQEQGEQT